MTQESTQPDTAMRQPRIVSGDQLAKTRLGPPPAPRDPDEPSRDGTRLVGCLLAVVAEGSNALASDIALDGEETQLVLEVDGARSAGWPWSEVINISADGIALDPDGVWTQLLEVSTSDHTFRFLAPAYKIGPWVSALPAAGRNCLRALKEPVWAVDSLREDSRPQELPRESNSGESPGSAAVAASGDGHFGGYRRMGEDSKEPRQDAGSVVAGPSTSAPASPASAPASSAPPPPPSPPFPSLPFPSPTSPSPQKASPPGPWAPLEHLEPRNLPIPPSPTPSAPNGPGTPTSVAGEHAAELANAGTARRNRHAKRRLFGRSARSENRHQASRAKLGRSGPLHAQPLTAGEVIRNLLTWTAGSGSKRGVVGAHGAPGPARVAPGGVGLGGVGLAGALTSDTVTVGTPKHRRPKRGYSTKRRFATLGLGILIAGTTAAGTAAAFQTGSNLAAPHVIGPVVPDQPQTHGLVTALAPPPKIRFNLARAKTKPKPASATLLSAPSLQSHEIFAFAPYWTLPSASSFNVANMTTLSYFGVDVNANGTIDKSGDGWTGYESQDLSDLISRAHAAGDRVVLTAECFSQATLDAVTSDPTAGTTLGNQLVKLVEAKNLDGINIDFEGEGPSDQKGLDRLMAQVSSVVRHADSHWQITMDTYASSAGDPDGFYDIRGLAPSVDAFFVMAYQMGGPEGSASTEFSGSNFTSGEALKEYLQVVPASQVILGLPFYGYSWTTTGPSATASATGPATPVPDAAIPTAGKSVYWSLASHTAFISYKVGKQWHQTWFEDATSLSERAQLAGSAGTRGVGIWALGMEGNDPAMLAALVGNGPVIKDYAPSPVGTNSPSGPATTATTRPRTTTTTGAQSTSTTSTSTTATTTPQSTSSTDPSSTTTTEPSSTTTEPTTTTTTVPESTTTTADVTTTTSS